MLKDPTSKIKINNVWLLRSIIMMVVLVFSILLLFYSISFLTTYQASGNTTSYFPWAWQVAYTNSGTVLEQFYLGLGVSISLLVISSIALLVFVRKSPEPLW